MKILFQKAKEHSSPFRLLHPPRLANESHTTDDLGRTDSDERTPTNELNSERKTSQEHAWISEVPHHSKLQCSRLAAKHDIKFQRISTAWPATDASINRLFRYLKQNTFFSYSQIDWLHRISSLRTPAKLKLERAKRKDRYIVS